MRPASEGASTTDLASYLVYVEYVGIPLFLYALLLVALKQKGLIGEGKPLTLMLGCILMIKTLRGRTLIDRVGQRFRRFWNVFGDVGIVLGFVGMGLMFAILVYGAWRTTQIPAASRPGLGEALAIPGLNPLLPLGYGLFALIVAVVLHELCHGVLARANGIGVKSLGVLLLVIPLGAFVEQDEKEMIEAPARKRDRVAAAGVMANFTLAVLFLLLMGALLTSSVHVKADGVGVLSVYGGTPAANTSVTLGSDGISPGDIITNFNGTATTNYIQLDEAIRDSAPGTTVMVTWYSQAASGTVSSPVTLSAARHYPGAFGTSNISSIPAGLSFLGVGLTPVSPGTMENVLAMGPAAPGTGYLLSNSSSFFASSILFLALPTTGTMPVQGPVAEFYTVGGPLGILGPNAAWVLINTLYWLVWVNVILGIFNALPAVPLDGGFLFRDVVGGAFSRLRPKWTPETRDRVVGGLSMFATLLVFALILWELFAP